MWYVRKKGHRAPKDEFKKPSQDDETNEDKMIKLGESCVQESSHVCLRMATKPDMLITGNEEWALTNETLYMGDEVMDTNRPDGPAEFMTNHVIVYV